MENVYSEPKVESISESGSSGCCGLISEDLRKFLNCKLHEILYTKKGKLLLTSAALGALCVGAAAYGVLAIGKMAVGDAHFNSLSVNNLKIDHLKVKYLEVDEQI